MKKENPKKVFNKYAREYQAKFMDLSDFHPSFDLFCKSISKKNAAVLDLGCGPGNITQYLLSRQPDFKILGIDLAPQMIELAKTNNPAAAFQIMDVRNITSLSQKFDAIIAGFCLPYLTQEEALQLIADAATLLTPNGVLYLSTMEDLYANSQWISSSSGDREQLFIHYHQADYLLKALAKNGFQLITLTRLEELIIDGVPSKDMYIIGKKATF